MPRWLRRLGMISSTAALLVLAGCGSAPGASHTPGTTPSPIARATPTPAATTAATPSSAPSPAPTPPFPWPSAVPTVGPGQVEFALLVVGTPAPGEQLSLYFQAPHAGQDQFLLCGGANPCRQQPAQVYTWGTGNLPAGPSPWAFQKSLNGTTTTIQSGTVDPAQGAVVTAVVPN